MWRSAPLPRDWPTIRPRILRRDPRCTIRTHCWGAPSTDVDHIGDPEDHTDPNLRGACATCHAHRTAHQGQAALQAKRAAIRPKPRHPALRPDAK